jgi:hypothetical protein
MFSQYSVWRAPRQKEREKRATVVLPVGEDFCILKLVAAEEPEEEKQSKRSKRQRESREDSNIGEVTRGLFSTSLQRALTCSALCDSDRAGFH